MFSSLRGAALAASVLLFFLPAAPAQPPVLDRWGDPLPAGAVARLGTLRFHHNPDVTGLAFAPDGRTLASGGQDKAVRLWDAATGKVIRTLTGHQVSVSDLVFAPDGSLLATGGED